MAPVVASLVHHICVMRSRARSFARLLIVEYGVGMAEKQVMVTVFALVGVRVVTHGWRMVAPIFASESAESFSGFVPSGRWAGVHLMKTRKRWCRSRRFSRWMEWRTGQWVES